MPMGTTMQRIYKIAEQIDNGLTAYDFPYVVVVRHEDGSHFVWDDAFAMIYFDSEHTDNDSGNAVERPGEWLMVFTEHHLFHVYHLSEIVSWAEYQRVQGAKLHSDHPGDRYICRSCGDTFPEVKPGPSCPNHYCEDPTKVELLSEPERTHIANEHKDWLRQVLQSQIDQLQERIDELEQ